MAAQAVTELGAGKRTNRLPAPRGPSTIITPEGNVTTNYNATVELDTRENVDELLVEALAAYHPATGRSIVGNVQVTITVPGEDMVQVMQTTIAVLARALAAPVLSAEIMATVDFDRRLGMEPVPELLSVTQVAARLGVSRQAVLQRLDSGSLPGRRVGATWTIPAAAVDRETAAKS